MEKMMTHMVTTAMWYPVPISEENSRALEAGRNTSPWTCFQPYSSPKSFSYKSKHILIYWQMDCNGSISNNMTDLISLHQFTIPITGRSEIRVQCKVVIIRENLEVFNQFQLSFFNLMPSYSTALHSDRGPTISSRSSSLL